MTTKADMFRAIKRYLNRKRILFLCTAERTAKAGDATLPASKAPPAGKNADFAVLYRSPCFGIITVWLKVGVHAAATTPAQKRFHKVVLAHQHLYLVVKSARSVSEWFQSSPVRHKKITQTGDPDHSTPAQNAM
jgi:hypothetical protein